MNNGCVRDFYLVNGDMDRIRKVLREEGTPMGKGNGFEIYNFGCTFFVFPDKVRVGGILPATVLHYKSQLEQKAESELKEGK